jgi:putative transposase
MDFMSDLLTDGRKVRVFNVLDDCNKEAIAIEAGLSYPAGR